MMIVSKVTVVIIVWSSVAPCSGFVPARCHYRSQNRLTHRSSPSRPDADTFPLQHQLVLKESTINRQESSSSSSSWLESIGRLPLSDWLLLTTHALFCFLLALALCGYEDYDCSHLKPNAASLRQDAIRGLGRGRLDRLQDWKKGDILVSPLDKSLKSIPSYNEVMENHRLNRVPRWATKVNEASFRDAVDKIYAALDATNKLKVLAQDYDWDGLRQLIRQPVLSSDLEQAASVLRGATDILSADARSEIGFNWGSCAWRHCGAQADAQEALAELHSLTGVLEPFEVNFCADIVERSLRDILAVIPSQYKEHHTLTEYQPYESQNILDEEGDAEVDQAFMRALSQFRTTED